MRERNFRFHLCAAVTVLILSGFYDLSRAEYCLLFLCIGSVLSAELMNTAVESAADLLTGGRQDKKAKTAKDCAAGAVLAAAFFAALCGAALFWDTAVFSEIAVWFSERPWAVCAAVIWLAAAFIFVFAFDGKK